MATEKTEKLNAAKMAFAEMIEIIADAARIEKKSPLVKWDEVMPGVKDGKPNEAVAELVMTIRSVPAGDILSILFTWGMWADRLGHMMDLLDIPPDDREGYAVIAAGLQATLPSVGFPVLWSKKAARFAVTPFARIKVEIYRRRKRRTARDPLPSADPPQALFTAATVHSITTFTRWLEECITGMPDVTGEYFRWVQSVVQRDPEGAHVDDEAARTAADAPPRIPPPPVDALVRARRERKKSRMTDAERHGAIEVCKRELAVLSRAGDVGAKVLLAQIADQSIDPDVALLQFVALRDSAKS